MLTTLPLPVLATGVVCTATVVYSTWLTTTHGGECSRTFAVLAGLGAVIMLLLLLVRLSSDNFVDSQLVGQAALGESYSQLRQLYDLFSSSICLIILNILSKGHHKN
jgi:O-antigen ligase